MRYRPVFFLYLLTAMASLALTSGCPRASSELAFTRTPDVIYGRKYGMSLTMDVFAPKQNANGAAVIWVLSGGWFSTPEMANFSMSSSLIDALVGRGYTVFTVAHGSQPRFTIPEMLLDMHRAVRFIRYHAADYGIDPTRIGIVGASAGGHLALMQGMAGDNGTNGAKDPIDGISSRVQAVACFFPPTDFLNYGKPGIVALGRGPLKNFPSPFAFQELKTISPRVTVFVPVTDEKQIRKIGWQISPINYVTADDPPTLIIQGDQDKLVPMQQAETMVARLKAVGVSARLIVKPGGGHGWKNIDTDMPAIADWFDQRLQSQA